MPAMDRKEGWGLGANNRHDRAKLPASGDGQRHIVDGVNVDIMPGGSFCSRIGFELDHAGSSVRSLVAGTKAIFFLDGTSIQRKSVGDSGVDTIGSVTFSTNTMAGDIHNGETFLLTSDGQALRCIDRTVRRWGVKTVTAQPIATLRAHGNMPAGRYQYACTLVNQYGEEGGTVGSGAIELAEGYGSFTLSVMPTIPAGHYLRIYASPVNGSTLYFQTERTNGDPVTFEDIFTDSMELATQFMREPPGGHIVRAHNGTILIADSNVVWVTQPMRVNLVDMATGFYQFESDVTNVERVDGGVFITTRNKTYFLTGVETSEPSLREVLDVGGFMHSGSTAGPDRVAWMTEYGQAFGSAAGNVTLPHRDSYAPLLMPDSSSAKVRHNGNELIVTAPKQPTGQSSLKAGSYFDADVLVATKTGPLASDVSLVDEYDTEVIAP